jgi:hypothetical protein
MTPLFRRLPSGPGRCWAVGTLGPGSAGASTLAVAVTATLGGLLVEADADGGVLGARYGEWLDERAPNLASLLAALHTYAGLGPLEQQLQRLPGGGRAVLSAPDAESVLGPVLRLVEDLDDLRSGLEGESLVLDIGRVRPGSASLMLAEQADALIAVVRPDVESLGCLMARVPTMVQQVSRLLVAVRGHGPYDLADIRAAIAMRAGVRIAVLGVPDDVRAVQALSRARRNAWSALGGAGLMHSAGVVVSLLNGLPPDDGPPTGFTGPSVPLDLRLDADPDRRQGRPGW